MRRLLRGCTGMALVGLLLLAGCGGPARIDGSSDKAFTKSLKAVKAALTEEDEETLQSAFMQIAASEVAAGSGGGLVDDPQKAFENLRRRLDGMTAEEIIDEAAGIELSPMVENSLAAASRAVDLLTTETVRETPAKREKTTSEADSAAEKAVAEARAKADKAYEAARTAERAYDVAAKAWTAAHRAAIKASGHATEIISEGIGMIKEANKADDGAPEALCDLVQKIAEEASEAAREAGNKADEAREVARAADEARREAAKKAIKASDEVIKLTDPNRSTSRRQKVSAAGRQ